MNRKIILSLLSFAALASSARVVADGWCTAGGCDPTCTIPIYAVEPEEFCNAYEHGTSCTTYNRRLYYCYGGGNGYIVTSYTTRGKSCSSSGDCN